MVDNFVLMAALTSNPSTNPALKSVLSQSLFNMDFSNEKHHHQMYLKEFRTQPCPLFAQHKCNQHRPYTCFYWHFPNQKRRVPRVKPDGTFNYSPDVYCNKYDETSGHCPDIDDCPYVHRNAGDTERRYHPRYFKTGTCIYETNEQGLCSKNGAHCAFAHGAHDLRAPVYDSREMLQAAEYGINNLPASLEKERVLSEDPKWNDMPYVLSNYKTEPCKKPPRMCRQGYACPFYHNPKDRRRNPKAYRYRSTPCPTVKQGDEWRDSTNCDNGDNCSFCHTRTEQQFHPEIYKSTKCHDMINQSYCPRGPFCAFAHTDEETSIGRDYLSATDHSLACYVSSASVSASASTAVSAGTPGASSAGAIMSVAGAKPRPPHELLAGSQMPQPGSGPVGKGRTVSGGSGTSSESGLGSRGDTPPFSFTSPTGMRSLGFPPAAGAGGGPGALRGLPLSPLLQSSSTLDAHRSGAGAGAELDAAMSPRKSAWPTWLSPPAADDAVTLRGGHDSPRSVASGGAGEEAAGAPCGPGVNGGVQDSVLGAVLGKAIDDCDLSGVEMRADILRANAAASLNVQNSNGSSDLSAGNGQQEGSSAVSVPVTIPCYRPRDAAAVSRASHIGFGSCASPCASSTVSSLTGSLPFHATPGSGSHFGEFPTLSSSQLTGGSGSNSFFERSAISPCSGCSSSFSNLPQSPILMNSPFSNAISDIERLQLEREMNEAKQRLKTIQEERDMAVYQRDQALAKLTELQLAVSSAQTPSVPGDENAPIGVSDMKKAPSDLDSLPRERLAEIHSRLREGMKKIEELMHKDQSETSHSD